MANRSDFFSAKLPRQWKRILAMGQTYGWDGDEHNRGNLKNLMIQALWLLLKSLPSDLYLTFHYDQ